MTELVDAAARVQGPNILQGLQGLADRLLQSREETNKAFQVFVQRVGFDAVTRWVKEQQKRMDVGNERRREVRRRRLSTQLEDAAPDGVIAKAISLKEDVNIAIVTTASLPWMTGTAVNPLLRAAYLSKLRKKVTLLVPWLSPEDQREVFPHGRSFGDPKEQESYVREWVRQRVGFEPDFKLTFYPGRYASDKGSIFAIGDVTRYVPDAEAQVAVLEEPEHLNWYHRGRRWSDKFKHVVGIVHTNYLEYVRREENGQLRSSVLRMVNDWVVRAAGVHQVVKLSDAVQDFKRAETCFVHGVSPKFIEIGRAVSESLETSLAAVTSRTDAAGEMASAMGTSFFDKDCYFLGKVLWGKGYSELLNLVQTHTQAGGLDVPIDVFGGGPDLAAVRDEVRRRHLNLNFLGARDHSEPDFRRYKVFINPSMSDVVATTTAEALAMGKFVICADHPSNFFFKRYANCLTYRTPQEFSRCLARALATQPTPLTREELDSLSWEAATDRFLRVAEPREASTGQPRKLPQMMDSFAARVAWHTHQSLNQSEGVRKACGAAPGTSVPLENLSDVVKFDEMARARRARKNGLNAERLRLNLIQAMGLQASQQKRSKRLRSGEMEKGESLLEAGGELGRECRSFVCFTRAGNCRSGGGVDSPMRSRRLLIPTPDDFPRSAALLR